MNFINEHNVDAIAGECYTNVIINDDEFWEDYDRIKYIKRLFNRYRQTKVIKTNLVMNHLIILYNVFETKNLTRLLFYKFEGYHECLKPFLIVLQRMPDKIQPYTVDRPILFSSDIPDDPILIHELRTKVLNPDE